MLIVDPKKMDSKKCNFWRREDSPLCFLCTRIINEVATSCQRRLHFSCYCHDCLPARIRQHFPSHLPNWETFHEFCSKLFRGSSGVGAGELWASDMKIAGGVYSQWTHITSRCWCLVVEMRVSAGVAVMRHVRLDVRWIYEDYYEYKPPAVR